MFDYNYYLAYYMESICYFWTHMHPQHYIAILVSIGLIGYYMMKQGAEYH